MQVEPSLNTPLISVVIACYNDHLDIKKAVYSILTQTYNNIEIIVIDDGSNDKTKEILESIKPNITKLITQNNQGQSIARNNGIKLAKGEYILNLDSDDYFEPTFCEKAIAKFESDNNISIVTCFANRFCLKGDIDIFKPKGGTIKDFLFFNSALGSSMFKRKLWVDCGGYEESLPILGFEDWELYINILKKGGYAYVLKEILFNYQVKKNSTTQRIKNQKLDKYQHIIFKHKDLYIENFDNLIIQVFNKISREESEKIKKINSLEYKIGLMFLRPFRFVKKIFA